MPSLSVLAVSQYKNDKKNTDNIDRERIGFINLFLR